MLIYVRESERADIMTENYQKLEIIPKELQLYFEREENYRNQIEDDKNSYQFNTVYLMSQTTVQTNNWDGLLIAQRWK